MSAPEGVLVSPLQTQTWEKIKDGATRAFSDHLGRRWTVIKEVTGAYKKLLVLEDEELGVTCLWMPKTSSDDGKLSNKKRQSCKEECVREIKNWEKLCEYDTVRSCAAQVSAIINYKGKNGADRQAVQMQYYPFGDLFTYFNFDREKEANDVSFGNTVEVAEQLLRALVKLWDEKIVHKDIKMENILLAEELDESNPEGETVLKLKLTDLGFTVFKANEEAQEEDVREFEGSAEYMAPELVYQKDTIVPEKIDIFSAGVLLLMMIGRVDEVYCEAEKAQDNSKDDESRFFDKLHTTYRLCAKHLGESENSFYRLVGKMLNENPILRPTAREALDGLNKILEEEFRSDSEEDVDELSY